MKLEWLILADSAQIVGNKLYLLGGGWDLLAVNTGFPVQHHCAVAAALRVPWHETNQKIAVSIQVIDEDPQAILFQVSAEIEVGRPAGILPGQDQFAQVATEFVLSASHPGTYVIVAVVDGQEQGRYPFRIVAGPLLALRKAAGEGSPD